MASKDRAQASRENGQRSQGPVTSEGKSRIRLNALKGGLFAKELVIAEAGETEEEFLDLQNGLLADLQPTTMVEEILVHEMVGDYWRMQRARRCETAEIRRNLETAETRSLLNQEMLMNSLRGRFYLNHAAKEWPDLFQQSPEATLLALEGLRREMRETSTGLEFLAEMLMDTVKSVEFNGHIPREREVMLVEAFGAGDAVVCHWMVLNTLLRKPIVNEEEQPDVADRAEIKEHILNSLRYEASHLRRLKDVTEELESVEERHRLATLVVPSGECLDRVNRAETAMERRFYKAHKKLIEVQALRKSATRPLTHLKTS